MRWIKKMFGIRTPLEKKRAELSKLRHQAVTAQRNGDLRTYGSISKNIEELEDEIVDMINEGR